MFRLSANAPPKHKSAVIDAFASAMETGMSPKGTHCLIIFAGASAGRFIPTRAHIHVIGGENVAVLWRFGDRQRDREDLGAKNCDSEKEGD